MSVKCICEKKVHSKIKSIFKLICLVVFDLLTLYDVDIKCFEKENINKKRYVVYTNENSSKH